MALSLVKTHSCPFPGYLLLSIRDKKPIHALQCCFSVILSGCQDEISKIKSPFLLLGKSRLSSQAKDTPKNLAINNALPSSVQWCVVPGLAPGLSRIGIIPALLFHTLLDQGPLSTGSQTP